MKSEDLLRGVLLEPVKSDTELVDIAPGAAAGLTARLKDRARRVPGQSDGPGENEQPLATRLVQHLADDLTRDVTHQCERGREVLHLPGAGKLGEDRAG